MVWLIDAKYLNDYKIWVKFNDNTEMIVNLEEYLDGTIFEPLKNVEQFKQVKFNPDSDTIEWDNGADFAPVFLREIGESVFKTA